MYILFASTVLLLTLYGVLMQVIKPYHDVSLLQRILFGGLIIWGLFVFATIAIIDGGI